MACGGVSDSAVSRQPPTTLPHLLYAVTNKCCTSWCGEASPHQQAAEWCSPHSPQTPDITTTTTTTVTPSRQTRTACRALLSHGHLQQSCWGWHSTQHTAEATPTTTCCPSLWHHHHHHLWGMTLPPSLNDDTWEVLNNTAYLTHSLTVHNPDTANAEWQSQSLVCQQGWHPRLSLSLSAQP